MLRKSETSGFIRMIALLSSDQTQVVSRAPQQKRDSET
jgi:hypothetical protein